MDGLLLAGQEVVVDPDALRLAANFAEAEQLYGPVFASPGPGVHDVVAAFGNVYKCPCASVQELLGVGAAGQPVGSGAERVPDLAGGTPQKWDAQLPSARSTSSTLHPLRMNATAGIVEAAAGVVGVSTARTGYG